jgi:hypothetical protein
MSTQPAPVQPDKMPGAGGAPPSSPALPDLNVGRYSFETVQQLVDRAAWINMFAIPGANQPNAAIRATGNLKDVIGIGCSEVLHRFEINMRLPSPESGMKATNVVGEPAGKLDLRWMVIPDDFAARPGLSPPQTSLDPSRSQRFVIQEGTFRFGNGQDGFRSFGTGRTFPTEVDGQTQLIVAAIGNITDGFGRFSGLEGTYILSGHMAENQGFFGDIMARIVDPNETLRAQAAIPPIQSTADAEPGITYLTIRSQKSGPSMETTFNFGPDGQVRGVNVPQELRHVHVGFTTQGNEGFRSEINIGPVIGEEIGFVHTTLGGSGTGDAPLIFQGVGNYWFTDHEGQVIGTFTAQFLEGRNFAMQLAGAPGQQAFRFGFFGPLLNGTGCFSGVEGMLLGSTGVGISPHVLSNLYILRLRDPKGKFRASFNGAKG